MGPFGRLARADSQDRPTVARRRRCRRVSVPRGVAAAALLLIVATPLAAQPWRGSLRARGVVGGPGGEPVAGATVRHEPRDDPGGGPPPATTDRRGRWAVPGLAAGVWRIEIGAEGFFPVEGEIALQEGRASRPVEIVLRSLDEATPTFYEGNPATIVRWIEAGNALLAAGETARARSEYEKALEVLPRQERPHVLKAVARTWFLEGEIERTIESLSEALSLLPGDIEIQRLLTEVLETVGRGEEAVGLIMAIEKAAGGTAEEWAEAMDRGVEGDPAAAEAPGPPLPPLVEAAPGRTGAFRTRLFDRHPLAGVETWMERVGRSPGEAPEIDPSGGEYDLAEETFEVYVPESYREDAPVGLFVWISPTPFGGFRSPAIAEALDRHRVIWVGADASGNLRLVWYRTGLALDAVQSLGRLYAIDPKRVWVGGHSGGSRVASSLLLFYPEVFRGAILFSGADYYRPVDVPDRPGAYWPPELPKPPRAVLERVKRASPIVQIAGELDFNRAQTRAVAEEMRRDGFEHVTYLEVPGAEHTLAVDPAYFDRALALLDAAR